MFERCEDCGKEYQAQASSGWRQCPSCESRESREYAEASHYAAVWPDSRKEQMRERLGVSGDVDE